MRKITQSFCICLVFCIVLAGLTIVSIVKPSRGFSENENRYLQTLPELTAERFFSGVFGEEYETYLADQFIARDGWIGLKSAIELARGMKEVNGVYFGRDGYLIEKTSAKTFESAQAQKNMEFLKAFVDKYSDAGNGAISCRVLFVPTAAAVLRGELPVFAPVYDQDKWLQNAADALGKDVVVPIMPAFFEKISLYDNHRSLYYHTDHHWTSFGAFTAYEAWAKAAGVTPVSESEFNIITVTDSFYGTLNSKVNIKTAADAIEAYEGPGYNIIYNEGQRTADSLYDAGALNGKDKYAFFLGGNFGLVDIKAYWPEKPDITSEDRRLLIIKDSYANSFAGFIAPHFASVLLLDLRHTNAKVSDIIENYKITDILVLYSSKNFVEDKNIYKLLY